MQVPWDICWLMDNKRYPTELCSPTCCLNASRHSLVEVMAPHVPQQPISTSIAAVKQLTRLPQLSSRSHRAWLVHLGGHRKDNNKDTGSCKQVSRALALHDQEVDAATWAALQCMRLVQNKIETAWRSH